MTCDFWRKLLAPSRRYDRSELVPSEILSGESRHISPATAGLPIPTGPMALCERWHTRVRPSKSDSVTAKGCSPSLRISVRSPRSATSVRSPLRVSTPLHGWQKRRARTSPRSNAHCRLKRSICPLAERGGRWRDGDPPLSQHADAGEAATFLTAAWKFNNVVTYAASRPNAWGGIGLVKPLASAPVRAMMGEVNQVLGPGSALISIDLAIAQGFLVEMTSMNDGGCR